MSTRNEETIPNQKINLSLLGQYYHPINANIQSYLESSISSISFISKKKIKLVDNISCSNKMSKKSLIDKNTRNISNSESVIKKCSNSYNISSRGENTTMSTIDDRINQSLAEDEKIKINKIKELMICFLCNKNSILPKLCPNCRKIACQECLKKWYLTEKNNKCFYCKNEENYSNMVGIPIISNISIILNKINSSSIYMNTSNFKLDEKNEKTLTFFNEKNTNSYTKKNLTLNNAVTNLKLNLFKNLKNKKLNNPIRKIPFIQKPKKDYSISEHCPTHPDELLFYYCSDCQKSYCRTCFVFFGKEKNNHIGHKIIDYQKMKNLGNQDILSTIKYLKEKFDEIDNIIEECEVLKKCYTSEKEMVNKYMKIIINKYNEKIDEKIKKLNELIINYKSYIENIKIIQDNIQKYIFIKYDENENIIHEDNLLINVAKIKNLEYLKNTDIYVDLSPKIIFNVYQTEIKQFDIFNVNFRLKAKLNNSHYNLIVLKKEKEIQIYIYYPCENNKQNKRFILPYVYLKKKDNDWEIFELDEFLIYKNHNYFIKRFDANKFCKLNDFIKIKGVLYETSFI